MIFKAWIGRKCFDPKFPSISMQILLQRKLENDFKFDNCTNYLISNFLHIFICCFALHT